MLSQHLSSCQLIARLVLFLVFLTASQRLLASDPLAIERTLPVTALFSPFLQMEARLFDERFDLLDFADQLGGASKPKEASTYALRFGVPFSGSVLFTAGLARFDASAVRTAQPFELDSRRERYELGLHLRLPALGPQGLLSFEVLYDEQDKQVIDCLASLGVVLGGSCPEADFRLFDGRNESEDTLAPLTGRGNQWTGRATLRVERPPMSWGALRYGGGIALSRVSFSSRSPIADLTSPFILDSAVNGVPVRDLQNALRDRIPQSDPWLSTTVHAMVGNRFSLGRTLSLVIDLKGSFTTRSDYEDRGRAEKLTNAELSAVFLFEPSSRLLLYGGGRALSNYLLGEDAFLYTPVSSRFFQKPYGEIFFGVRVGL